MAEYEVLNYSNEDSFESFCKKNKGKILKKLKGKKMKKRHLRNARKLLDESTGLPAPEKNEILLDAIGDTVNESESEGFEGEEFDHFRFAQKLRKKVEQKLNIPLPSLSLKNIFQKKQVLQTLAPKPTPAVIVQNGQLTSPANPNTSMHPHLDLTKPIDRPGYTPTGNEIIEDKKEVKPIFPNGKAPLVQLRKSAEEAVPPAEEKKAVQEAKGETVASNGQLAFPSQTTSAKETLGGSETAESKEEPTAQAETTTTTTTSQGTGEAVKEPSKATETKPEEKKGLNKKWIWGGGIVFVVILIIILIIALKK